MKKGFTLIELMIVVAIIAIIAAIAIPNLLQSRIQANESNAVAALKQFAASQNTYMKAGYSMNNAVAPTTAKCYAPSLDDLGGTNAHTNAAGTSLNLVPDAFAASSEAGTNSAFQGYTFYDQTVSFTGGGGAINVQYEFGLYANPGLYEKSGINSYHIDTMGTVLQKDLAGAGARDVQTSGVAGWVVP